MDCLFCKIVNGDLPSYKVYENGEVIAFLDIKPVHPGHTLVLPKKHFKNIEETPEKELVEVIKVVKKVGEILKTKLGYESYNIQVNNDPIAGQVIPHLHFHVVPRKEGDGLELWPQGEYKEGEAEEILKKMTK